MNRIVRVVTRRYSKLVDKLITKEVINEVVAAKTAQEARRIVRGKYGSSALIGFNRKTNTDVGTYFPEEKELVGSNG